MRLKKSVNALDRCWNRGAREDRPQAMMLWLSLSSMMQRVAILKMLGELVADDDHGEPEARD